MAQGIGVSQREAQNHHIRPREGDMVFKFRTVTREMGDTARRKMAEPKQSN